MCEQMFYCVNADAIPLVYSKWTKILSIFDKKAHFALSGSFFTFFCLLRAGFGLRRLLFVVPLKHWRKVVAPVTPTTG